MSAVKRIVNGSLATWCRFAFSIISNIVIVPVYLYHWDADTYGLWLSLLAATSLITILDAGHQVYLEAEFLRIGRKNLAEISCIFSDGVFVSVIIGLGQFLVVSALANSRIIGLGLVGHLTTVTAAEQILVEYSVMWFCFGSIGGVIVRLLPAFGYYARSAWWGVFVTVVSTIVPAVSVCCGGSLLFVGRMYVLSVAVCQLPFYLDVLRILKREGIRLQKPRWRHGFNRFFKSLLVVAIHTLEMVRQQGIRLIIAPLAGSSAVATFSVNRTGASVALQAVGTITGPIQPEMMRYIHSKDQANLEACFATIWLTTMVIACPATIVVQAFAKPIFDMWTNNRIAFDPMLFALFSTCVLLGIANQPSAAILRCNNILMPQLFIGFFSCLVATVGTAILTSKFGLVGSAVSLVAAELLALFSCTRTASIWLRENSLEWPSASFRLVLIQTITTVATLTIMSISQKNLLLVGSIGVVVGIILSIQYLRSLPLATKRHSRNAIVILATFLKAHRKNQA